MIRSMLVIVALFLSASAANATAVEPVVAQMKIDSSAGRSSYWFEWRETSVRGSGSMLLKWTNYDAAIHNAGYNLQNARITVLSKPALPPGCRFEFWSSEIKPNGLRSQLGFNVKGASCKYALQDLAKGDLVLEFYHVPQLNDSTAIVPQLNLVVEGQ